MSMQTHRAELERRHHALELEIYEAQKHPSCDDLQILELKRRKLLMKDEIAPAVEHQRTLPRCVPTCLRWQGAHMRLSLCRCDYDTVIKRTFRSAAVDRSEMT
jgi:hypothetical protein